MCFNFGKLGIFICYNDKYSQWYYFTLFGIDYDWTAFEIRPFLWKLGDPNEDAYFAIGPFHFWNII